MKLPVVFGCLMLLILILSAPFAFAESTAFFCTSEEAAVTIAMTMDMENGRIVNREEVDAVAKPFIEGGDCIYIPHEIDIEVKRIVGAYGANEKINVVEFESSSVSVRDGSALFAFIPEREGSI